jgi:hypothetical protein
MVRRSSVIGVRFADEAAEPLHGNHLTCTLVRLIPSGPALRMWVSVDDKAMVFDVSPGMVPAGVELGDRLTLCLDPQWCRAFASTVDDSGDDPGDGAP